MRHGWDIRRWDVLDVTEALHREGGVSNVKAIKDVTKSVALADTLATLTAQWFPHGDDDGDDDGDDVEEGPRGPTIPGTVAVEAQHNANALMRGVAIGIIMYFRLRFPQTCKLTMLSGAHKLNVCTALGVDRGAGLADKEAVACRRAEAADQKAAAKAAKALQKQQEKANKDMLRGRGRGRGRARARGRAGSLGRGADTSDAAVVTTEGVCTLEVVRDEVTDKVKVKVARPPPSNVVAKVGSKIEDDAETIPDSDADEWPACAGAGAGAGAGAVAARDHGGNSASASASDSDSDSDEGEQSWGRGRGYSRGRGRGRGRGGLMPMSNSAREDYFDNKRRAVMAVKVLMPQGHPVLVANPRKTDDLCDVFLMALWALWEKCKWKPASRRKSTVKPKTEAPKTGPKRARATKEVPARAGTVQKKARVAPTGKIHCEPKSMEAILGTSSAPSAPSAPSAKRSPIEEEWSSSVSSPSDDE
jgi:hypothetical protein